MTDTTSQPTRPAGLVPDASTAAIAAYIDLRARMVAMLRDLDPAVAASTPVPACPAWTVTDAMAHVAGVCVDIVDGNIAEAGTTPWADAHVARFSAEGLPAILDRWEATAPVIDSLGGLVPDRVASQFCFDACTHEHDVRGALGRPGERDAASVRVGGGFLEAALDGVVRQRGLPALEVVLPDERVLVGEGPAAASVTLDRFEWMRAFGGRRSVDQIRALAWTGDPAPYLAVFEASPLSPPAEPLEE